VVTATGYVVGLGIQRTRTLAGEEHRQRVGRLLLVVGVVFVTGILVTFKYLGFLAHTANRVASVLSIETTFPALALMLPIGVSFWTFQAIAYVVDVYRGRTDAVGNPLLYALAVMFFPIVSAGPITRFEVLVPQLAVRHRFQYAKMNSGLLLIGRGFFKKLMVADRLGVLVAAVFDNPHDFTGTGQGLVFFIAAAAFAVQLYCDFSGYTDIVRGSARLFGVELPVNFRAPYLARSVQEFWRRWHITLMDWFRDYIYIPLGGNRKGKLRRYLNIMAVFLVSGLWHGAGFTFVIWGALNGLYQIVGELLAPLRDRVVRVLRIDRSSAGHRVFQTGLTFVLITVAWVFFRAGSIGDALYMLPRMFVPTPWIFTDGTLLRLGLSGAEFTVTLLSAVAIWIADWLSTRRDVLADLRRQPLYVRWGVYYGLILAVAVFGHYGEGYNAADFVYFRF
jgi:D-alanyl-lipoteichoic acid acyltransferase DltB (MBOAT superfamily)